jgi:hypothetical protein
MAACKHHGRDGAAEAYPELAAKFADSRKQDADSLLDPATSMLQAENSMLRSATSMLATGNSCAPSPSPSPSTKEYPPSFADAQEATPAKAKAKGKTFSAWIAEIRASGEKAISEYASVWEYAETVCLPTEWVELAWLCFRRRYQTDEKAKRKRYTDWRRVFLRAVKENWMGLWVWSDRDQSYRLTTVGTQADREMREVA